MKIIKKLAGVVLLCCMTLAFTMCDKPDKSGDSEKSAAADKAAKVSDAEKDGAGLMKRSDIDPKYTWNLKDLYETDAEWEKDFDYLKAFYPKIKDFEGMIGSSAEAFLKFLTLDKMISEKFEKMRMYASLSKDLDLSNSKYQVMFDRVSSLQNDIVTAGAFVRPEIIAIPESKLDAFIAGSEELRHYRHYLDNMLRFKDHTLTKEEESLLSLANPVEETFMKTYRLWANVDIQFPTVKDDKGEDVKMSHARYYSALTSPDRDYRKRAYKAIYTPFMNNINFLTSNYAGGVKAKIFNTKARKYNNTLEAALDQNHIPVSVYKNLVNTVNENLEPLQRWGALKKKLLKIKELHPYDTYVTLFPSADKKYTPDDAMDLCLKALAPLGGDYIKNLKFAFDNRWVDFYETENKRNGAYSTGAAKGAHPYVLMNWSFKLYDVFTLAHEMGHNMHSWYTANNQEFPYADYPIFVAEVAAITNEALLMNYLIENAETKEEKLYLIETGLNNIKGTFFRQTRFAEFEMTVQEMMEKNVPLTPDACAEVFGDMYKKYWGEEMVVDDEEKNSWPRIHHFYYNFYVYQYATSMAASEALAAKILTEGSPAVEKYLGFLKSGKTEYAIPTLRKAGVDMSSKGPILAVIKKANDLLNKLEKTLRE